MIPAGIAAVVGAFHLSAAALASLALLKRAPRQSELPLISIVVPARNEAHNLPRLFGSLRKLNYPADKIELILVNDDSTDGTAQIAENLGRSLPFPLRVIPAVHGPEESLPPTKTLPLAQGIDVATGDYVLMTDGDCELRPDWARDIVRHFEPCIGMVCGITLPDYDLTSDTVTKLETVDWALLLGACAGMCRLGFPLALVGNNYAVRRTAYHEVGSFRSIPHNRIDDIALFKAIAQSKKWKVAFSVTPGSAAATLPVSKTKTIVTQRYRWMEGMEAVSASGKVFFGIELIVHLLWPFALLLPWRLGLWIALAVLTGDWLVISACLGKLRKKGLFLASATYPLFACGYAWRLVGALFTRPEVTWKERKFA
ncbi:MAG: glycosyltransferase [Calditrichaeota bacterium]|nr:glycosyltransferase [Calditrichota bacterium]